MNHKKVAFKLNHYFRSSKNIRILIDKKPTFFTVSFIMYKAWRPLGVESYVKGYIIWIGAGI